MNTGIIVAILAIVLIFQGTKTTGPNPSFMKQVPVVEEIVEMPESNKKKAYELFTKLYQKNPELAEELGKIPEFSDNEVSDKDLEALVNMSDYFSVIDSQYPDRLDQSFEEILDVGIKDKRKYCSPLRFLFWLAEEKKFDEESISYTSNPLKYFSLKTLIKLGVNRLSKKTNNFNEVVKILNSPEVINYWAYNNVKFVHGWKGNIYIFLSPKTVFREKKGDCDCLATFAAYCLAKSGYDNPSIVSVMWGPKEGNSVATIEKDGDIYIVMNFNPKPHYKTEIVGPFEDYDQVIRTIHGKPTSQFIETYQHRISRYREAGKLR